MLYCSMRFIYILALWMAVVTALPAQTQFDDRARGMFGSVGVGPKVPIGTLANKTQVGYGFDLELSYTDNVLMPFFVYGRIGFMQFPGSQSFYQTTDYTHFSTNLLPLSVGVRHYFPPIVKNVALVMPVVDLSANLGIYQNLHQFKSSTGRADFLEEGTVFGLTAGGGVSMFLLDILANYNYFPDNQYLSFDLKLRIPLYITF